MRKIYSIGTICLIFGFVYSLGITGQAQNLPQDQAEQMLANCVSCHGKQGEGKPQLGFPRLAGLDPKYQERQLEAYANGTIKAPNMQPFARALSVSERQELAYYFATLVPVEEEHPVPFDEGIVQQGAALAKLGDWGHDVPPCASCHSPTGMGLGARFPRLSGQSASYIATQLHAWKKGTRTGDEMQLMSKIATRLSEVQINAVAAYYETQQTDQRKLSQIATGAKQ